MTRIGCAQAGRLSVLALALVALGLVATPAWAQRSEAARPELLPSPLRLEHVLRFARAHRDEITAARARARAASARPGTVSSLDDPMVAPSLDHLPFRLHGADYSLTIEQRFPLSGVLGNRGRAAEAEARRLRAEAERVGLDVELEAGLAFVMLHERRSMARILREQLAVARQIVAATSARYSAGTGSQPDVLRAEVEVARLEGLVRASHAEVRGAGAMLNANLGRAADASLPQLESPARPLMPGAWGALKKVALGRRPELEAARAEMQRAEAEVSVMESMYGPMAMVRTGPAYTMTDGPGWMLMVGVTVPIWRDRLSSGVREAQAMADMARADLRAMSRMVEGQAASARDGVLAARDRFLSIRDQVLPRARRMVDPSLAGYAAGTLPLVSVIEAIQALWSAEAELVAAEVDLGVAWMRLYRATAGRETR